MQNSPAVQPEIETPRLLLRSLSPADAQTVQRLAGDAHIAAMTEAIPHPYEDGMAEQWIDDCAKQWKNGSGAAFAVCLKDSGELIGCCGLTIVPTHRRATVGYWIGRDYWDNGYCTEAAGQVVKFGHSALQLHRIAAMHLCKNPASGAVMRKIGMKHEATLSGYVIKEDKLEDMELYSIIAV